MTDTQRYVYTCRKIPERDRDVAHKHQQDVDEFRPDAPDRAIVQNAVDLDEKGYAAYLKASNLLNIEQVVEAGIGPIEVPMPVETPESMMNADAVQRIPSDADLRYLRAMFIRESPRFVDDAVRLAVLDTGLGARVAGWLSPQIVEAKSFVGSNALAAQHSHGSHVACLALGDKTRLLHGEVLSPTGNGSSDGIIKGIYWAVERGARIINLSLSSSGGAEQFEPALRFARSRGCLPVCAGGNEALRGNPVRYPGACPSAISVAAFDRTRDAEAPFATFNEYIDLASSGVNVLSYLADGTLGLMSGSSQAAPLVCHILQAMMNAYPKASSEAVLKAVINGARDTRSSAIHEGAGVVNAEKARRKLVA